MLKPALGPTLIMPATLRKYLQEKKLRIELSRVLNTLMLTNPKGHKLIISTPDHRTYQVSRFHGKDARDELRKTYLTRLKEDRMMDELAEWLEIRPRLID
jgi:hypothetical protein